jgi:hypothetical protein
MAVFTRRPVGRLRSRGVRIVVTVVSVTQVDVDVAEADLLGAISAPPCVRYSQATLRHCIGLPLPLAWLPNANTPGTASMP